MSHHPRWTSWLAGAARAAVRHVERDQPIVKVRTLEQVVAESAAYLPARWATQVDPITALRGE